LAVTSQRSSGRWRALSPSVAEAFAWAASTAGNSPVNSAHLLFGLTVAHGDSSEVRSLLRYFDETEERVFTSLPDLDNASAAGSPPELSDWPAMTPVADQIYAAASALSTSVPYGDDKVHIPHLMAALIYSRADAAIALEMALPPLPPHWLGQTYADFLSQSKSSVLSKFLVSLQRPALHRRNLIGREDVLQALDAMVSRPGTIVAIQATPGVGSTAVLLELLQRSARRFRDGVSYIDGMSPQSDAVLRVPDGRLVVVDHAATWPLQMMGSTGGVAVVRAATGSFTGASPVVINPLSEDVLRRLANDELRRAGTQPTFEQLGRIVGLAPGRVDVLVGIVNAYPRSGRSLPDYVDWVMSIPPRPDERDGVMPQEVAGVYSTIVSLNAALQGVLRDAAFLSPPLVSPDHGDAGIDPASLAALVGMPVPDLLLSLEEILSNGLLVREPDGGYKIAGTVVAAARRFFAPSFEPTYLLRVVIAATSRDRPVQTEPPVSSSEVSAQGLPATSSGAPAAPRPPAQAPPIPSPAAPSAPRPPVAPSSDAGGYTPPDYAADSTAGDDALGRGADVEAVCMLATLKAAKPPLSIGLFGDWGSGKTFFMRMVADRIRARSEALTGGSSVFCTRVKHIWFNAWHYSDTELWPTLVTHIFEELSRDEKLTSPSIDDQKNAIEKQIHDLKATAGKHAATVVLRDKELQKDLTEIGIPTESLEQLIDARYVLTVVWPTLRRRDQILLIITVLAALGAIAVIATRRDMLSLLTIALPLIAGYLAVFRSPLRSILAVASRASQKLKEEDEKRQAEIATLERQRRDLEQPVETFIRQRLDSSDYSKQMGVISTARRDFEELSKRLAGPAMSDPDRIILYIDDLDRCEPKVVVKVLEAIHLLLAFELFVVIVGVDSRWLFAALEEHLVLMAHQTNQTKPEAMAERATPQDYLEKIFQIALQVRRMGPHEFGTLVDRIVGDGVRIPAPTTTPGPTPATQPPPSNQPPAVAVGPPEKSVGNGGVEISTPVARVATSPPVVPSEKTQPEPVAPVKTEPNKPGAALQQPTAAPRAPLPSATDLPIEPNPERLRLYRTEVDMMKHMSPLIKTPRSAKRLLNTYRLVRASIDGQQLSRFVPGEDSSGPYQVAILLLAVMIGYPDVYADVFRAIRDTADKGFIELLAIDPWSDLNRDVGEAIVGLSMTNSLADFRAVLPAVSRYSFKDWEVP
jgi:hypothetical protein